MTDTNIKLEHIIAVAVRLFAIALFLFAIRSGLYTIPYFDQPELSALPYAYVVWVLVLVFVSISLWVFPMTVSRSLVTFKDPGIVGIKSATADQIETIGFTILGLYLAFFVISDIFYWSATWFISQRNPQMSVGLLRPTQTKPHNAAYIQVGA